jgi:hypothetical protein
MYGTGCMGMELKVEGRKSNMTATTLGTMHTCKNDKERKLLNRKFMWIDSVGDYCYLTELDTTHATSHLFIFCCLCLIFCSEIS